MKITKSKEWYYRAYVIATLAAWLFCIAPTVIAGVAKLPVIATKEAESTLTGMFIVVLVCAAYPLFKGLIKLFKSPSAWLIMWVVALITFLLWKIPHDTLGAMVVVFFTAAVGNTIGAALFALARKFKEKWAFCGQVTITNGGIRDGKA